MKQHILSKTKQELDYSFEALKNFEINTSFLGFFSRFYRDYKHYVTSKETLLYAYSSVLSDITKDIEDFKINSEELKNITESMNFINNKIQICAKYLEKFGNSFSGKDQQKTEIFLYEKRFLQQIIVSFLQDTKKWFTYHKKEIEGEIDKIRVLQQNDNVFIGANEVLELQKTRLQTIIKNI
ncbi:hypothetical protein KGV52_00820 [Candidatus Gracilibacteria bacterium]|nr:hypothetical protein [Candidatus Gracilibacteria bacterium]